MGWIENQSSRWAELPRAARWGIFAGIGMLVFYLVLDPALAHRQVKSTEAERSAKMLSEYRAQATSRAGAETAIKLGTTRFGAVMEPSADASAGSRASSLIAATLEDREVAEWNIQTQRGVPVDRGVLSQVIDRDAYDLQRVVLEVSMTDRPDVVMAVLAEIERMPEVTIVGSVDLRIDSGETRQLIAKFKPETWVLIKKDDSR